MMSAAVVPAPLAGEGRGEGMSAGAQPRVVAANVLDAVLHRGRSLKAELAAASASLPDPRDRALVEAICFAALRIRHRGDAALAAWIPKPLPRRDAPLRALLLAGFAQLDPLGLPAHAAVAATVDAARAMGRAHQSGLVNALLRRAQRDGLPEGDWRDLWPSWLRGRLKADWPDAFDSIVAASDVQAPTWLRVNRSRGARDAGNACRRRHQAVAVEGLDDAAHRCLGRGVGAARLRGRRHIGGTAPRSRVADALAPPAGGRVLDACVAPGGKAAHLLERDPSLRLVAWTSTKRGWAGARQLRGWAWARRRTARRRCRVAASWWSGELFVRSCSMPLF